MESEHFDKYFVLKKRKKEKRSSGKKLGVFLLDTQTTPSIENLTQRWTKSGLFFFQYQGTFFDFQKRAGRPYPLKQSHECSIKKGVLKNFSEFTGKYQLRLRVSFLKNLHAFKTFS